MAAVSASRHRWRLQIDSREDQHKFLKAMQPKFLEVVHPRLSGLLDLLYQSDLLTDSDNESMSGRDVNTRKDQARKLWFHLNKIPLEDFKTHVFPKLLQDFPHIIPEGFLTQEGENASDGKDLDGKQGCLRHDIMTRIRPSSFADMLYHHDCLSLEDYERIASSDKKSKEDKLWTKLLGSFSRHSDDLVDELRALLQKHKISIPRDLSEVMSQGFHCTCSKSTYILPASTMQPLGKVELWAVKSDFTQSPSSTWSSLSACDAVNHSGSVCSNNSQFLGSDSSTIPDVLTATRNPQQHEHDGLKPNKVFVKPGPLPEQFVQNAESSLPALHDEAGNEPKEDSEHPEKSTGLAGGYVAVPKMHHQRQDRTTKIETDGKPGRDTGAFWIPMIPMIPTIPMIKRDLNKLKNKILNTV